LAEALYAVRSLLCLATNETPHERLASLSLEIYEWYHFCRHGDFGGLSPPKQSAKSSKIEI